MRLIILQRYRVGNATAGEGEAGLARQERKVLRSAKEEGMGGGAAGGKVMIKQRGDVRLPDRAIGNAAVFGLHLDHWFEPVEATGAVADDRCFDAAHFKLAFNCSRDLV